MSASDTLPIATTTPRFHRLRIAERRQETPDAISVSFDIPAHLSGDYAFQAGQYLTLRTTLDGEELRRSYSICSAEGDGTPRIAIKRLPGGAFSEWAQQALRLGVAIDVMTPTGRFGIPPGADGRVHVAFAAGSGITPVLSIMQTVLGREPHSHFFLFYGSRSSGGILFRGMIEDLKDRYLGRLSVFHVLSRELQDVDVLNGRLDQDKLSGLVHRMLGGSDIDAAYICGPTGMIAGVEATLAAFGVPEACIHVERFTSVLEGRPRPPAPVNQTAAPQAIATVILDGVRRELPVAPGEAVIDAAIRAGLELPYACKGGMCCTCRAKLLEGSVDMALNYSLEPWETEAGFVLTCQARPTTSRVTLDYDQR